MLQPNLGTTIVLAAIALALCFVAGAPAGPLAGWSTFGLGAATGLALAAPYRRARVLAFLDPWADPMRQGLPEHPVAGGPGRRAASPASGLGASRAKWGFLPYAHSDFIFAVIGEELGLVGATVVVGLFVLLAHRRHPHRAARPRPLRPAAGHGRHGVVLRAGVRQHRRRDRHPAHHRRAAALRERRRLVARVRHGRGRACCCRWPARPPCAPPPRPPRPKRAQGRGRSDDRAHGRRPPQHRCFALIAGGGTAGHVQPAIAIARALVDRGHKQSAIELVGSERGIEARLVPEAGFELTLLPGPRPAAQAQPAER